MRIVSRLLSVIVAAVITASCSGGAPPIRDYRSATPREVSPQSLCIKNPDGGPTGGWICSGDGGGGGIATTECLTTYGCTMESVQYATVPDTFDPSTVTNATSACAAIDESFDSVHKICFSLGSSGTAQFGFKFTYYTYGQCRESLTGMHPGYSYQATPSGHYVLWCVTPGQYEYPATAWYNVETTFLAFSSSPIALGILDSVPAGSTFGMSYTTVQSAFTKMDEKYCPATQSGAFIGLCGNEGGGGISVGLQ